MKKDIYNIKEPKKIRKSKEIRYYSPSDNSAGLKKIDALEKEISQVKDLIKVGSPVVKVNIPESFEVSNLDEIAKVEVPDNVSINNAEEIGKEVAKNIPAYVPPTINIPEEITVKNMPQYPDFPRTFKVDNLNELFQEGNNPKSANPTRYLPVRLTNGKNFMNELTGSYVAASKAVFPFVNMTTGKPQPAAVDNSGIVQTNASGTSSGGGGGVVTAVSGTLNARIDNWPTIQTVMVQNQTPTGTTTISGLINGVYGSIPTVVSGSQWPIQIDQSANLKTTLATALSGEDTVNNVLKVEQRFSYTYISTATTTTIKTGAGFVHTIVVEGGTGGTIICYDNTAGSGTVIASFDSTSNLTTYTFDVVFATGLTIVTSAATKLTVSWR